MERTAEATYEAVAPIYDDFTAGYDYELWLGELLSRLEALGLRNGRLLDVACGTGKSFMPMLERGWEVTGCDISPAMLQLAQAKAGGAAKLSIADMRALPTFGEFDLVWALTDPLNYLLTEEELQAALQGMAVNLAPAGLLAFDLNTQNGYRAFAEASSIERNGVSLTWKAARQEAIKDASFEMRGPGVSSLHRQRHFSEREVLSALDAAGLTCLEVHGLFTDAILRQPLDERRHTKAVYMARAADSLPRD